MPNPQNLLYKLVKVTWTDIAALDGNWVNQDELALEAWKLYNTNYYSVGLLVYEAPDFVVIAATWDGEEYNDCSMIPRSVIKKIKELRG